MSSIRNPVGPQSPKVYWRRRLFFGLGILAVVVVIILIVVRPGSGGEETSTSASSSASTDSSAEPEESTPAESEGADCKPGNVKLVPVTDKDVYGPTEQPLISMEITNTGSTSCMLNAGTTQQLLTITSGAETYWVSSDCQTEPVDAPVMLEAGVAQSTTPIPWDRTRSDPATCGTDRPAVPAGGASYHLAVAIGEIAPETTKQFILQ